MGKLAAHIRNAFLAGALAIVPVAVTAFAVWYVESQTRAAASRAIGRPVPPFVGVLLAVALVYAAGVAVTSLVGRLLLGLADRILARLPLVRAVYGAWKQVALTPGGGQGMYARVVLVEAADPATAATGEAVPDNVAAAPASAAAWQVGFTSGTPVPGAADLLPVFVPQCPNPLNGRLLLVPRSRCRLTDVSPENAFKMLLSSGNYVPPGIGR